MYTGANFVILRSAHASLIKRNSEQMARLHLDVIGNNFRDAGERLSVVLSDRRTGPENSDT